MSVSLTTSHVTVVALRKESVDRNQYLSGVLDFGPGSLSARRAWIEMGWRLTACPMMYVALRKESVDRNRNSIKRCLMSVVALRKESVDRNCTLSIA